MVGAGGGVKLTPWTPSGSATENAKALQTCTGFIICVYNFKNMKKYKLESFLIEFSHIKMTSENLQNMTPV